MLTEKDFNKLLDMAQRKDDFFKGKDAALLELIEMCKTEEQKELLYMLLDKFSYVTWELLLEFITDVATFIKKECRGRENEYCVVAMTDDKRPDSGELITYLLKLPLVEELEKGIHMINRCGQIRHEYNKYKITNFIIVDTFSGSGKTIRNRYNANMGDGYEIQFCVMTGMKYALEELRNDGIKVECIYELEKGISEHKDYSEDDKLQALVDMLDLESQLASRIGDRDLTAYSLGYGKSESLIAFEKLNTPNNVFPVFWWKKTKDNVRRETLVECVL